MTQEIKDLVPSPRIDLAREKPFRLSGAEVRPATREVRWNSRRETLQPRVMQVLVALARANGETITRDDLTISCWDGVIVSEDSINRVISRLRRLAETTGGWSVETITKVGYRIVVYGRDEPAMQPESSGALATIVPGSLPQPHRRWLLAGGGAAVLGGAAVGSWWLTRPPPQPSRARDLVLRARDALAIDDVVSRAHAIAYLREAVAAAPNYAEAWGLLALGYFQTSIDVPEREYAALAARADDASRRALDLDPANADALAARALFIPTFRNWRNAELTMNRVLMVAPRHPILLDYAWLLVSVGRCNDALGAILSNRMVQPEAPRHTYVIGVIQWAAGHLEEADRTISRGLEAWPRYFALWFLRFWFLTYSGRAEEAISFALREAGRPVGIPTGDFELILISARAIATRTASQVAAAVSANREAARRGSGYASNAIEVTAYLGALDASFEIARGLFLDEGFELGASAFSLEQSDYRARSRRETVQLFRPPAASMRADPRFARLCGDMGLEDYWRACGYQPDYRRHA
jgi:DNA-binding winged helix-turn-helix (wHTH) protein/Tfp pilus assembly protein PilF